MTRRRRPRDLGRRVERLEQTLGTVGCPNCRSRVEVIFRGEEAEAEAMCPRCSRPLLVVEIPFCTRERS